MNQPTVLERELTAWFIDVARPRIPDYVDDILLQTAATPQRPAWTFPERWLPVNVMTRGRLLIPPLPWRAIGLLAILVALLAAMLAAYAGSSSKPGGVPFTSTRYSYSILFPDEGWTVDERPGTWGLGDFFEANSDAGVDYFERMDRSHGLPLYLYLSSQPIPAEMDVETWIGLHDAATGAAQPCFDVLGTYERRLIDGETARIAAQHCRAFDDEGAWTTIQTLVAHDGRGYAIYVWPVDRGAAMPPVDRLRAEADRLLDRVSFTD